MDTSKAVPKARIKSIPAKKLQAMQSSVLVLDIRRAGTVKELGVFPGALNIPAPFVLRRIGEIPKGKPIVLIDYNGKQFIHVGRYLAANGYKDIQGLRGGLITWIKKGYKLQK